MSAARVVSLLLVLVSVGCGGSAGSETSPSALPTSQQAGVTQQPGVTQQAGGAPDPASGLSQLSFIAGAPGTPSPTADPAFTTLGGSGTGRFQMGAAQGLYVVDPVPGGTTVEGFVVVAWGPIGTGNFLPPADATVTLNGVPLLRDPNLNGAYWRVDPAGPQPLVGPGGHIVLVASGTDAGTRLERSLVLPCPDDITVTLGLGSAGLHLSSASDITLNVGIPLMVNIYPRATLYGYDPATRALSGSGSPVNIGRGALALDVPITPTTAPAYLLDLRWPGSWIPDGESGAFCGLAKRWAFAK